MEGTAREDAIVEHRPLLTTDTQASSGGKQRPSCVLRVRGCTGSDYWEKRDVGASARGVVSARARGRGPFEVRSGGHGGHVLQVHLRIASEGMIGAKQTRVRGQNVRQRRLGLADSPDSGENSGVLLHRKESS
mmetsp:Transcript_9457/g.38661  ORF Transcript_9457/g.38661 Transcript_9457/m.38661 type:complete len:133 (+) Transcript_9457:109-507(+)